MSMYVYQAVTKSIIDRRITFTGLKSMKTYQQILKIINNCAFEVSSENIEI